MSGRTTGSPGGRSPGSVTGQGERSCKKGVPFLLKQVPNKGVKETPT